MATPDDLQADNPDVPAMPYVVASWLGFSLEHIVAGLRRGSIAPPEGAPPGWLPPGAEALDDAAPPDDATASDDAPPPDDDANLRETYSALVRAIDPDADAATVDALWTSGGADDTARAASLDALLWRTVGDARPAGASDGPAALADAIARRGIQGTLVALGDEGSAALAQRARGDASALAALASADAYAFVGRDGGAARFDPMSGERRVSDAWIDDRAKLVAWRAALAADAGAASGVTHGWRFVDRSLGGAATLVVGPEADAMNQVVFGDDDGDALEGGLAVDRLHGGRGDDTLEGGAGADYLEGGGGRDRYVFAAGDGVDIVDDVDGQGEIVVDGVTLDGDDAGIAYALADDGALTITTAHAGDAIRVAGFRDGMLGIHVAPVPEPAMSAPGAASGVLKPLITAPLDDRAYAPAREDGNESGSGAAAAQGPDHAAGTVAAARATAVDADAWASVLKPRVTPPSSVDVAPPDVDAGAVTAADYAAALASHAGDDDDDGLATDRHAPWYAVDDLPSAWAPPEAPPRRP